MAISEYSVRKAGAGFTITAKVHGFDEKTGQEIVAHDFTGRNAITYPAVLATLTDEQQQELVELVAIRLVEMKAEG